MTTSQQEADRPPAAATELSGSSETDRCARLVDRIIEGRCRDEAHKMFLFSKPQQPQHTTPPNRWYHLDRRRKRGRSRRRGFILIPTLLLLLMLDDTRRQVKASPSAQTPPFYEQPQPLVYLHETGSGEGALYTHLPMAVNFDQVSGNSASPSLITAKCWNNYETDNDCKQINVIAPPVGSDGNGANQLGNPNFPAMAADDDNSLITPVVIFESSSTLLPEQQQQQPNSGQPEQSPQPMVPPYFSSSSSSSTSRPSGGSDTVVLARHRTPPTANDVYAAPPAGATHLPSGGGRNPQSDRASGRFEQPATRPSTSVFVATPQPKRLGSTTTAGRRCRDENDADCDEPEDGDDADDTSGGTVRGGTEPDDADDSAAPDDDRPTAGTVAPQGSFGSAAKSGQQAEIGSGDGPEDDNEDDSDDDPDGNLETSGNSEPPAVQPTLHADVTSGYPQTESRPSNESPPDDSSESTSGRPGAEIEVVVHPTLPPTFPVTTTPHNRPTDFNRHHHHHLSSATSVDSVTPLSPMTSTTTMFTFTATMTNTETQQQSTTNMPDDTFTSKPIFPPSTTVATSSNNLSGGGSGGNQGTRAEADNGENSVTVSSTELDLATFRAIPMPPPQQPPVNHRHAASESHRAHSNQSGDSNSDNIDDRYRFTPPSGSAAPPGRFEHNPWMAMPVKPPLNQVEQLQQQQRQQQVRPRKDPPSGRLEPVVSRMQTEVLPTLLLYASIVILTVTALIFVLMAFAFYRRNNARKRALMAHKANIINGLPNPMVSMASMQQPGLLSTYAPGKVTTSVIKPPSDERILPADDDDNDNQSKDPFNGSLGENQPLNQPTSSWSTEDPTTSSGSQKTADSQQAGPVQTRIQYPNSLSDGRQNSSSLSDSQGSPEAALMTRQDGLPLVQQQQHQQQSHQQHQQQQPPPQQQQQQFEYQPANPNYQPPPLQQQQSVEYNFRHPLPHLQQGQQYPPPVIAPSVKKFISSRSVENINHDNGLFIDTYPPPQQTQPYVQPAQQSVPFYNGYPPTMEGLDDRLGPNAQYPINQFHHHHQQFNEPASPGRVAINPNATLGRRFQPGFGLNRNIYSEDSSSVITASPSLARTSSSLSFAFSSNNQQPPPIRAKPLIDPSGRMLNDYTRPSFPNAPPVRGPKGRSEAWYV